MFQLLYAAWSKFSSPAAHRKTLCDFVELLHVISYSFLFVELLCHYVRRYPIYSCSSSSYVWSPIYPIRWAVLCVISYLFLFVKLLHVMSYLSLSSCHFWSLICSFYSSNCNACLMCSSICWRQKYITRRQKNITDSNSATTDMYNEAAEIYRDTLLW